jgi:hypothetical protein
MRGTCCWWAVGWLLLACARATADPLSEPPRPTDFLAQAPRPAPAAANQPAGAGQPGPTQPGPAAAADQQARADLNQQAAQDTSAGTPSDEAPTGVNPHMIGDFPGAFTLRTIAVPAVRTIRGTRTVTQTTLVNVPSFTTTTQTQFVTVFPPGNEVPIQVPVTVPVTVPTTVTVPVTTSTVVPFRRRVPVTVFETVRVLAPFDGGFKITENESALPEDRVFAGYNFYSNVTGPPTPASLGQVDTVSTTAGGRPATVSTLVPGVAAPAVDVHREVIGFEKTFLDGLGSVEVRLPVLQLEGEEGFGGDGFGDVTAVLKLALLRDRRTGDVLAAGLAVTAPTGRGLLIPGGELHPTLLQPFVGYLWSPGRLYLEGFTSLAVPTDSRDVTLLFNDVALGYVLYRGPAGQVLSGVAPVIEAHVNTPLNHRGTGDVVTLPDLVDLTGGVHLDLYDRSTLTLGAATPVTGPKVFDIEAIVQFNWRF